MKILIVDDEPLVRMSLSRALRSKGHTVQEAEDGLRGEAVWLQERPDIVVLDVLMPGLTGPQLIEKVQGRVQSKIVLISAYAGEYDMESAKRLGADLFIQKPFENIMDVIEQIENVVS